MQTSFGFGFGSPTPLQQPKKEIKIAKQKQTFSRGNSIAGQNGNMLPQPNSKGIGSSGTDFMFNRFGSRGMSVLSPMSAAGGGLVPLKTPHGADAHLMVLDQYNISFCKPTGPNSMGQNLETNQDVSRPNGTY